MRSGVLSDRRASASALALLALLAGCALPPPFPETSLDDFPALGPERELRLADGMPIRYVDLGGAGPPLVLVHGLGADHHQWDPAVEAVLWYRFRPMAMITPAACSTSGRSSATRRGPSPRCATNSTRTGATATIR